jgi:hypothetical protein
MQAQIAKRLCMTIDLMLLHLNKSFFYRARQRREVSARCVARTPTRATILNIQHRTSSITRAGLIMCRNVTVLIIAAIITRDNNNDDSGNDTRMKGTKLDLIVTFGQPLRKLRRPRVGISRSWQLGDRHCLFPP